MTALFVTGCQLPVDQEVVSTPPKEDDPFVTLMIPSDQDYSGVFISTGMMDLYKLIYMTGYDNEKIITPPQNDTDEWFFQGAKIWAEDTVVQNNPELITVTWDADSKRHFLDLSSLKNLECVKDSNKVYAQKLQELQPTPFENSYYSTWSIDEKFRRSQKQAS